MTTFKVNVDNDNFSRYLPSSQISKTFKIDAIKDAKIAPFRMLISRL